MAKFMVELYRGAKGTSYVKGTDGQPLVLDKVQADAEMAKWSPHFSDTIVLVEVESEALLAKEPTGYKLLVIGPDGRQDKLRFGGGPLRGRAVVFPDPDAAAPLLADAQAHGVKIQVVPTYTDAPNHDLLKTK